MAEVPLYHPSSAEAYYGVRYYDFRIRRSVHVPGKFHDLGWKQLSQEYRSYHRRLSV